MVVQEEDVAAILAAHDCAPALQVFQYMAVADLRLHMRDPSSRSATFKPKLLIMVVTTRLFFSRPWSFIDLAQMASTWSPVRMFALVVDRDHPVAVSIKGETRRRRRS